MRVVILRTGIVLAPGGGALASMLTGALCIPLFKFAVPLIPGWGPVVSKAEELGPSFLLSLLAGVVMTVSSDRESGPR